MRNYIYRLWVTNKGTVVKTFLGNDKNDLMERFEMWFIKQGYDRADIQTSIDYIQHASNI